MTDEGNANRERFAHCSGKTTGVNNHPKVSTGGQLKVSTL